jgi:hypothetical protein
MSSLLLDQFRFTMPLSLGGFLLACSPLVIAAFVSRSANAADMLAVHYVTIGIVAPASFCALRLQTVTVKFMPEYPGDRRLLWYSIAAGLVLGVVPLAFSTSLLGDWYFGVFQNVPPRILGTAKLAMGIYSVMGVIQAVRGRVEGLAAGRKRPKAVMWGQFAYTMSLLLVCAILLPLGFPGWTIAVSALIVAPVCVSVVIYAFGTDADGDGVLSLAESDLVAGWDCGAWFVQEGFDGGRVESSTGSGDLRTLAFTVGLNARTSSPVSVMATVDGASAFTGLAPSMFYRRSWNMMRLAGRGLDGSSDLLEVRVVPGSLSVFLR